MFYMAVGVKWTGPGFRVFMKGCPRGSSVGIGRLLIVISIVFALPILLSFVTHSHTLQIDMTITFYATPKFPSSNCSYDVQI